MSQTRYNLRAADEAQLRAALASAGVIDQWGNPVRGLTLDVIGVIRRPTGEVVDVDGVDVQVFEDVPGWHANLIATLSEEQEAALPLIPPPAVPFRVFAGE